MIDASIDSGALAAITEPAPAALPQTDHSHARAAPAAARFTAETILALRHWTPSLLSFRTSRAPGFRFTPGHYARLGLDDADDGWGCLATVLGRIQRS